MQNNTAASLLVRQANGSASSRNGASGHAVPAKTARYVPGGAPCASWPLPTLASMSCPTASLKKVPPLFSVIATNHGATIAITMSSPTSGRNCRSHPADRSAIARMIAASSGTAGVIGPLTRMPTPIATQNAIAQPQESRNVELSRLVHERARAAIPITTVAATTASVLARRASTPSRMTPAISAPAMNAARRVVSHGGRISQQDCQDSPKKGRDTIEPDRPPGFGDAHLLGDAHDSRLHPVDADWLLVPSFRLEPDVHEVAALEHLLGRLRKTRLVAIHRWQAHEARREHDNAEDRQERHGAGMASLGKGKDLAGDGQAGHDDPLGWDPDGGDPRSNGHDGGRAEPAFGGGS